MSILAVYPVDELSKLRPDWSLLHGAGFLPIPDGEGEAAHFHDYSEYLFVLEGAVEFNLEGDRATVEPGEVILVQAGRIHAVERAVGNTVLLSVRDEAQAPFRPGNLDPAANPFDRRIPPKVPLANPGRRGTVLGVDPGKTFVPGAFARSAGDIGLEADPASMGRSFARAVREECDVLGKAVAFISCGVAPPVPDLRAEDAFARVCRILPRCLAVEMDPAAEGAPTLVEELQARWLPMLRTRHIKPALRIRQAPWRPAQMAAVAGLLADLPPAEWGVVLDWDSSVVRTEGFRARAMIAAMAPWLESVVCDADAVDQTAHYLAGLGCQAWVLAR